MIGQINMSLNAILNTCSQLLPEIWNTHRHMLGFFPGDAVSGLYCSCLHFLLVFVGLCLQLMKCIRSLDLGELINLTNIPLFCLKNSLKLLLQCVLCHRPFAL